MRQPGEPAIEDILQSIKRVIAREDRSARPVIHTAGDEPADTTADDPDVLDLGGHEQTEAGAPAAAGTTPLVTDTASQAMRGSLDALAVAAKTPAAGVDDGSAIEALLRDLLRPALSDWLDRNLPAITERMVAAEIARITGRRG